MKRNLKNLIGLSAVILFVGTGCVRKPTGLASSLSSSPQSINSGSNVPTCSISLRNSSPALVNNRIPASGATLNFQVTPSQGASIISNPSGTQVAANGSASPISRSFSARVRETSSGLTGSCSLAVEQSPALPVPSSNPTCTITVGSASPALVNNQIPASGSTLNFNVTPSQGASVISNPSGTQVATNTSASPISRSFSARVIETSSGLTGSCSITVEQSSAPVTTPTCAISVGSASPALVNNQIPASGSTLNFNVTPSQGASVISNPSGTQVAANSSASPLSRVFSASVRDASSGLTGVCSANLVQLGYTPPPAIAKGKIVSVSATDGLVGWVCERSDLPTLPGLEIELASTRTTIQAFQELETSDSEALTQCLGYGMPYRFRVPYYFLADHAGKTIQVYAIPSFSQNVKVLLTNSNRYTVPALPSGPTCTFSVARQGSTSICNVSIQSSGSGANLSVAPQVNKQDPAPGGPWIIDPTAQGVWSSTHWLGTVFCPTDRVSAVSSYLKLQSGGLSQPCSENSSMQGAPIMVPAVTLPTRPTCTFSVFRQGTTSTCYFSVQSSGTGVNLTVPPQINKQDPVPGGAWIIEFSARGTWNGSAWTGTASCPTNRVTAFSSYLLLQQGGLSDPCGGQPIVVPSVNGQ